MVSSIDGEFVVYAFMKDSFCNGYDIGKQSLNMDMIKLL